MNGPGKHRPVLVASKGAVSAELRERAKDALERARAQGPEEAGPPPDPVALAAMEDALMRLSWRERDVFLAVRVDDLPLADIARAMGLSVARVEQLFARAFRNLERNLANPRRHGWRRWIS